MKEKKIDGVKIVTTGIGVGCGLIVDVALAAACPPAMAANKVLKGLWLVGGAVISEAIAEAVQVYAETTYYDIKKKVEEANKEAVTA